MIMMQMLDINIIHVRIPLVRILLIIDKALRFKAIINYGEREHSGNIQVPRDHSTSS